MNKREEKQTIARVQKIGKTMSKIHYMVNKLYAQIFELDQHYHHRIAAHKAHHTMKKRQLKQRGK